MMLKKPELKEAQQVHEFLRKSGENVSLVSVWNNLKEDNESLITYDEKITGVVLAKSMPDMLEIISWSVNRDDRSILDELFQKSRSKGYKQIGAMECEKNTQKIKLLMETGFREVTRLDGIFKEGKAIAYRKRL